MDSAFQVLNPGSSLVEFGFRIPIVSEIPDFLSCIPTPINDSGFPGIQISLLWEESRIGHFLVAFLDEMIYKKYNKF